MRVGNRETAIDFMGKGRIAMAVSALLVAASLVSIVTRGLNFDVDFTGGTVIEVGYQESVAPGTVRGVLTQAGFPEAVVQYFGTTRDILIRLAPRAELSSAEISTRILESLRRAAPGQVELRRVEFVGPQVGEELANDGGLAVLYALIGILIYVALRFEKRFALGAVGALVHDVTITVGFFSVLQWEFGLPVLAAILAVIGYSLNDTIVVFDRIRDNFRTMRKAEPRAVMNSAINQTLSRTLITSLTTLFVVIALFIFGGEVIHGFAAALIVGIVVGTYSSIYVASAAALALGVSRADLMPVAKEGQGADDRP